MRLTTPTDFEILSVLSNGKRNNAVNIAAEINKQRNYVNTRLPELADYGLIRKVGPATNSGLYVITDRGTAAVALRDAYDHSIDFDAKIDAQIASHSSTA